MQSNGVVTCYKITEEGENNIYFANWLRFFPTAIGLISTGKDGINEFLVERTQWVMS